MPAPSPFDTIVAIATPPGRGAIGIVRMSGPRAPAIAEAIAGRALAPRRATFAQFSDAAGRVLDQGLVLLFAAPASYTGETVVELQGHGSPAALRLVLARCVDLGARLAQPGEFTQRAFLNGKLDLAQAESVADLIDAGTATAARAAARSLTGEFSREVHAIDDALTELRMFVEATLDFPEEDLQFVQAEGARDKARSLLERLDGLISRAGTGARLHAGLAVVLIGRPNVGKSSLMNRLVREEAAIVTPVPGTTRDSVERVVEIAGIPLTVIDTAGLRETNDEVERMGIARTWSTIGRSDLALVLVDAREAADALPQEDSALLAKLPSGLPHVVVHNKADLAGVAPRAERRGETTHLWLSALTGDGVELLERQVLAAVGVDSGTEDVFIARERHLVALRSARGHLAAAIAQLEAREPPLELFAEELRAAHQALGEITGGVSADDLLGVIFSRFCIGK